MATLTGQAPHRRFPVDTEEDVGALRRAVARTAAGRAGLRTGEAELAATELGTNLLRHAHPGGYVLFRPAGDGIEMISVDHGPGIPPERIPPRPYAGHTPAVPEPPPRAAGGLGAGLAAVHRLARDFDCHSTPDGTVVLARLDRAARPMTSRWRHGGVNVPFPGEDESGDGWAVRPGNDRLEAAVVDGLGHGPPAAAAARAALAEFGRQLMTDPARYLRRAHEAMRATRGGVLGTCLIDADSGELTFAGVGNITGRVLHDGRRHPLLGRPGTLGTQLSPPKPDVQRVPWTPGSTLVLTSDGIRSGWDVTQYRGLLRHDPAVIAAVLHRDHGRLTDDATVLIVTEVPSWERGQTKGPGEAT
ncbi:SpoIIE family protein phosphatase [Streptomyces sp. WMMC500]|uniref:SpoIIE family protein phosphatase n=1 Tax=Streptomyces sp. WMMC500 TaxID=3015154 RepID=UPI00248B91F8|nr:SpoIIE family protein phosphatase [Streptomyces sp. WMMC500]WBB61938.1 SpoIIE family protein phosphatase [Streptomyces sp. WMMC500]